MSNNLMKSFAGNATGNTPNTLEAHKMQQQMLEGMKQVAQAWTKGKQVTAEVAPTPNQQPSASTHMP